MGNTPNPSRRLLLAALPALAVAAPASAAPHPDAELLAAAARFRALTATHAGFFETIEDDDERDEAIALMHADWEEALDALCDAPPARTLAGVVARAVALVEYDREMLKDRHGYWDGAQLAPLLRDLVALGGAP